MRALFQIALAGALSLLSQPATVAAQDWSGDESDAQSARGRVVDVTPYIEARQVLTAEIEPGDEILTYSSVAAGVDAVISGRRSEASASVRYERRFSWDDEINDGDTVSGVARGSLAVVRDAVTIEACGLGSRTRVGSDGGTTAGGFAAEIGNTSQIYTVYGGPSLKTRSGAVEIEGDYRIGYSRVDAGDLVLTGTEPVAGDLFDDGVVHSATARLAVSPRSLLPFGAGVSGGWTEQNASNLDQRIRDRHARAEVTVPLSRTLAVVGGVGYEDVEVSSRDALRDEEGDPVIGSDGRYVTDESGPRRIAYQADGIIWDAGVLWRPSRRTSLSAHVGHRYDSTTYYGNLSYAPNARSGFNVSVYDGVTGFGGSLVERLAGLPTRFSAFRNPITGEVGSCVASAEGGNCVGGAGLGSIRSAAFRSRGASASYAMQMGRTSFGLALGYDNRKYIAAEGTVLAQSDGVVDENFWLAYFVDTKLDRRSNVSASLSANWFESGFERGGAAFGYSASLAYYRTIIAGLTGTAAVGLDGITRDEPPDFTAASALLGLRYSF